MKKQIFCLSLALLMMLTQFPVALASIEEEISGQTISEKNEEGRHTLSIELSPNSVKGQSGSGSKRNATNQIVRRQPDESSGASAIVASGNCGAEGDGSNVTWMLNRQGALTLQGTGAMRDNGEYKNDASHFREDGSKAYFLANTYMALDMPWVDYREQIRTVDVKEGVTSLGLGAFAGLPNLRKVTLPDSLRSIGHGTFGDCANLSDISIPDNVMEIGRYAFFGCKSLIDMILPSHITKLGEATFGDCDRLTTVRIPNGVTTIEQEVFGWCVSLKEIIIPNSVTAMGDAVFYHCESLSHVGISNRLTRIGPSTFAFCNHLESVEIPEGVKHLQYMSFCGCENLLSVTLPVSISSIGNRAFEECSRLAEVRYAGNAEAEKQVKIGLFNEPLLNAHTQYGEAEGVPGNRFSETEDSLFVEFDGFDSFYCFEATDDTEEGIHVKRGDVNDSKTYMHYSYVEIGIRDGKIVSINLNLGRILDPGLAVSSIGGLIDQMPPEIEAYLEDFDIMELFAEVATACVATLNVTGNEILINAELIEGLDEIAKIARNSIETALEHSDINMARYLSNIVTLSTQETGQIIIRIHPDILTTEVDKIRVQTPTYALTFRVEDLRDDLHDIVTITTRDIGSGFAPGSSSGKTTVNVQMPNTHNSVTLSLPSQSGDKTYQTIVNTEGDATASKYNSVTSTVDGRINQSGNYTVITNEKDFSDIANKSADMREAILFLASKGVINGTTATTFSPDNMLTRAQVASLIMRALGKIDNSLSANFTDVSPSDWYYHAAASSQKHKIIQGYDDRTFRGGAIVNKTQIIVVSGRILTTEMNYKTLSNPSTYLSRYRDGVPEWAQSMVALATKENLVVYREDKNFSGGSSMTRGDAAIVLSRLFKKIWL